MRLVLCSVFDVKAGVYSNPQCFRSNGEAIRSFCDACNDERSQFSRHASDYSFWKIGTYEDSTGELVNDHVKLIEGVEAVSQKDAKPRMSPAEMLAHADSMS